MESKLSIIKESHRNEKYQLFYQCLCECGNTTIVRADHFKNDRIKSCGCIKKDSPSAKTHGMRNSKEYSIWSDMKKRCTNPKAENYKWYGAKGIKVCDRWQTFSNFLEDMGKLPTKTSSIERIENDKDYCKENCKWIEFAEQAYNRKNTIRIIIEGKTYYLKEVAELKNITYKQAYKLYKENKLD